jgi:hypothetical protein
LDFSEDWIGFIGYPKFDWVLSKINLDLRGDRRRHNKTPTYYIILLLYSLVQQLVGGAFHLAATQNCAAAGEYISTINQLTTVFIDIFRSAVNLNVKLRGCAIIVFLVQVMVTLQNIT